MSLLTGTFRRDKTCHSVDDKPFMNIPRRLPSIAYTVVCAALFAFPLLLSLHYQANFFSLSNESLAYRFFASERILNGEGGNVWLPQGHLTSSLQHVILWGIDRFAGFGVDDLQSRIQLFSIATLGINVLLMSLIFGLAAWSHSLRWTDRLLLAFAALAPIYVNKHGIYFYLRPDYLNLDIVLMATAVFLFQREWRRPQANRIWLRVAYIGVFCGLIAGTKISMAIIGIVLFAPALLSEPFNAKSFSLRLILGGTCALLSFLLVLMAFYLFDFHSVLEMFTAWGKFALNPGGENNFWSFRFNYFLREYFYGYIILFWIVVTVLFLVGISFLRKERTILKEIVLFIVNVLVVGACVYFLVKRPAGTTFFEVSVILVALSAIVLSALPAYGWFRAVIPIALLAWVVHATVTFPYEQTVSCLKESSKSARYLWGLHNEILRLAGGRQIIVIFPNNKYHHEGVQEFLLKGAADFPTWNISSKGQWIIDKYAPGMTFRHEGGGTPPNDPIPGDVVVLWFDRPDLQPLTERYPELRKAVGRDGTLCQEWVIEKGGNILMAARACLLS